jgi:hypothetical protein
MASFNMVSAVMAYVCRLEVTMKRVTLAFLLTLSSVWAAHAAVIDYIDTSATPFVTINGTTITGNGGLVTNYSQIGEAINFTFQSSIPVAGTSVISGFTNLTEPGSSTVSDRIVLTLTGGSDLIGVQFGSDANLPVIPSGAVDLTTIAAQGLPSNPYHEDGTLQLVATFFSTINGVSTPVDRYFIQSGVATPLPAALPLFATGLGGLGLLGWRRKRKAQAVA